MLGMSDSNYSVQPLKQLLSDDIPVRVRKKCSGNKQVNKTSQFKQCLQCSTTFQFKRLLIKHTEDHVRNNCCYCSAHFTNRKELTMHVSSEHNQKIEGNKYQCLFCDKTFGKNRTLLEHYKVHANGQWVCIQCGQFFKSASDHEVHQGKHKRNKQFNCERCRDSFSRKQQYLMHLKDHEKYKCQECGECFASKNKFKDHQLVVHNIQNVERRHQCTECGQRFSRPTLLMLHLRVHTGEKPHECKDCGKKYCTPSGYAQHLKSSAHQKRELQKTSAKIVKCPDCDVHFTTKHILHRHILQCHKRDMLYKCDFCGQKFNCKENMKRHFALHIKERQFVCEHCAAAFHSMNALKDHISYVHSIEREFVCAKCGISFKRNSGLNRHMASHSQDRPFVCHCGSSYKRSSHLRRHKVKMHGDILKNQKLVRLKQNEKGSLVQVDQQKENKRMKKPEEKCKDKGLREKDGKEVNIKTLVISLKEVQPVPSVPSPPSISSLSCISFPTSSITPNQTTLSLASSSYSNDQNHNTLGVVLPSEKRGAGGKIFQETSDEQIPRDIINNCVRLESVAEELVVTEDIEERNSDQNRTFLSGNVLHTVVSYNTTDLPTSLGPMLSSESQLVFRSAVPISSINIDSSHKVLTLTFDPLLESATKLKLTDSFAQEKSNGEEESSLLLDSSVSSHLTFDSLSDSLFIPNVVVDRVSGLLSTSDTVLTSSVVPMVSDDTVGSGSTLFSSVDAAFGSLQHSEVLLNMPSHVDLRPSIPPYSLSNNLSTCVSDCESLLSSQNNACQNSPSLILTQETEETIGLENSSTITVLPDYLPSTFSFLNV